jgi:hypothetical protein
MLLEPCTDLRSGKSDDKENKTYRKEYKAYPRLAFRVRRHKPADQSLVAKSPDASSSDFKDNGLNQEEKRYKKQ